MCTCQVLQGTSLCPRPRPVDAPGIPGSLSGFFFACMFCSKVNINSLTTVPRTEDTAPAEHVLRQVQTVTLTPGRVDFATYVLCSFIHSFHGSLPSTCFVQGLVVGSGETSVTKTDFVNSLPWWSLNSYTSQ